METTQIELKIGGKKSFVEEMKIGMRVKTPKGNGVIKSIIEDIHCHVNVTMDNGEDKNFMLYEVIDNKLVLNLNYCDEL